MISSNAVHAFARDAGTGAVTLVESEPNPPGNSSFRFGAIAPDGGHLYVGSTSGLLRFFARDADTGELTFAAFVNGVDAESLAISSDGQNVYVCEDSPDEIRVYDRNPGTGALSLVETESLATDCRGGVSVSPDGVHVHALQRGSFLPSGAVSVLERDPGTGELTFLASVTDRIGGTRSLTMAPDGGQVYGLEDGATRIFARDAGTGLLSFADGLFSFHDAHAGSISPDGAHVYLLATSALNAADRLGAFSRDPATGALTLVDTELDGVDGVSGLDRARQVVVSGDGASVYTVSRADELAVFSRDAITGELDFVETQPIAAGSWSVAASPDGEHVYAGPGNFFGDVTIDVFSRDGGTGMLAHVESESQAGEAVIAMSPDGAHLYAARGVVSVYARDAATGELAPASTTDEVGAMRAILVSPDGRHVYVAMDQGGQKEVGRLLTYRRDAVTGALELAATLENGDRAEGVYALDEISALAASPDGTYLFLVGVHHTSPGSSGDRGTLYVFRRDPDSGLLAFVQVEIDANGPLLDSTVFPPGDVLVSPDGAHVYRLGSPGAPVADIWVPGFGCAESPLDPCRTAEKGKLSFDDPVLDSKDRLTFTWAKGQSTDAAEFDPGTANHFTLCVYDESGVTPELVFGALTPAGEDCRFKLEADPKPCWTTTAKVVKLKDRSLTPDGIDRITLKSGPDGKAAIAAKGRSDHLRMPELPLGLPLRVQLQAASGLCWESVFETASRNDPARFRAKAD